MKINVLLLYYGKVMKTRRHKSKRLSKNVSYHSKKKDVKDKDYVDMIEGMSPGDLFVFGYYDWNNSYESRQDAVNDALSMSKPAQGSYNLHIMCTLIDTASSLQNKGQKLKFSFSSKKYVKVHVGECGVYIGKKYVESSPSFGTRHNASAYRRRAHCFFVDGKTIMVHSQNYANIIPLE